MQIDKTKILHQNEQSITYQSSDLTKCIQVINQDYTDFNQLKKLKDINSPYIVKVHSVEQNGNKIHIVMDYFPDNLEEQFKCRKNDNFSFEEQLTIIKSIILGMKALLERQIEIQELKPSILSTDGTSYKISNFILRSNQRLQPPAFAAPEIFFQQDITNKSLVFSLGIISYKLVTKQMPFRSKNIDQLLKQLHDIKTNQKVIELYTVDEQQKQLQGVVERMLLYKVDDRISWEELFQYPLFLQSKPKIKIIKMQQNKLFDSILINKQNKSLIQFDYDNFAKTGGNISKTDRIERMARIQMAKVQLFDLILAESQNNQALKSDQSNYFFLEFACKSLQCLYSSTARGLVENQYSLLSQEEFYQFERFGIELAMQEYQRTDLLDKQNFKEQILKKNRELKYQKSKLLEKMPLLLKQNNYPGDIPDFIKNANESLNQYLQFLKDYYNKFIIKEDDKRLKGLFIKAIKIQDYNVVNYSSIDPNEIFKNI
ncbi:hypothetical protein pb186bvf_011924 [Paramecium bursaria]